MNSANQYLTEISAYLADPNSSEHSYRTAFQNYLATIFPKEEGYFIQQDQKAINGNKPDYIVLRHKVPLLYIEVKKVGEDLNKIENSNQADRYFGYTNLIISDYLEFRFFRNGVRYDEAISLGTANMRSRSLSPTPESAQRLERIMRDFIQSQKEPIKSGAHLARIMGGKAQRIRDNVIAFLESESTEKDELARMMRFIKENLIKSFTTEDFADMYAQTLVYGLFAARYNDASQESFSRIEAQTLVPKSNPFLKHFFGHIAGVSFPRRLEIIVDELCEVFSHADVRALMEDYFKTANLFGEESESPDPVIHFYEDFLHEYDPKKKMEMGVFYTPLPVVRFIVRGIDDLLKKEFGIVKGLADSSKIKVAVKGLGKNAKEVTDTKEVHRVQVLDVATGTGTFLNETISHIYNTFKGNEGRWGAYVESDLLPRLHGFELMMASYTIAHLKLSMTLGKEGVIDFKSRLGVYLTNTLDAPHATEMQGSLFGVVESIAEESKLASQVKKDHPIMVVMGNPPYSGESMNPHYTEHDVYKVEPGGAKKLKEKNSKWINDDYVKFIRFAESMVEKNGEGVVGMITAHGYIDNPTFRGMRWKLRDTFDSIYVLDLHGNSNKKETAPDGSPDMNVFDIKTGVSILFGVKKRREASEKKPLATVYQADFFGKRAKKFAALTSDTLETIIWNELPATADVWKLEGAGKSMYQKGFSVAELFPINTVGVVTSRDAFVIDNSKNVLASRIEDFLALSPAEAKAKYSLKENQKWKVVRTQRHTFNSNNIVPISYRPFDSKFIYYHGDFVERGREKLMRHLSHNNIGLIASKLNRQASLGYFFIADRVTDFHVLDNARDSTSVFPLYLYENGEKVPNFNGEIVKEIEGVVGTTTPEDIFDYVYAVLHSPAYRTKFGEFLKSDFPRVPYPADKDTFWKLVPLGTRLRYLHLLTAPEVEQRITAFPKDGSDIVEKPVFKHGRVYINDEQYWDGVPEAVWNFFIGGYQPAQKYLKDRKGRVLTNAEFENYERMIVSLNETIKVMEEIDTASRAVGL